VWGGPVGPAQVTSRDYTSCDFQGLMDAAPGSGASWTFSMEYATLGSTQGCSDITSWTSVPLCTIRGTDKGCHVNGYPVNIVAPACIRGRATASTSPTPIAHVGGTAAFYCRDATGEAPTHFQTSASSPTGTAFYIGGVAWPTNSARPYWISTGAVLQSCSGLIALAYAPGSGNTWHFQLATSTTALTAGHNCTSLSYATIDDIVTISGATEKSKGWSPTAVKVPDGGCMQIRATCTGGSCDTTASPPLSVALDCSTSGSSPYNGGAANYGDAGSGAFDANHTVRVGPWGIADANTGIIFSQHYWLAPPEGLKACSGAFMFDDAITGTGQFDLGFTVSDTVPTSGQACTDLTYTPTGTLASIAVGAKSGVIPLTPIAIAGGKCFALNVATSGGTPSAGTSDFNWEAYCVANRR
jgi:hypothetical protein